MLLSGVLNSASLDLDLTVPQFIAKKQLYFDAYIKQKLERAQELEMKVLIFIFSYSR